MMRRAVKLGLDAATWVAFGLVVAGGAVAVAVWLFGSREPQ